MKYESDSGTNFNWCAQYSPKMLNTRTGGLGNKRTNGDHPNYSIVEIGRNTEKSRGDLRRLAVIQIPVRNHQETLVWKTLKREKIIRNDLYKSVIPSNFLFLAIIIQQTHNVTWNRQVS